MTKGRSPSSPCTTRRPDLRVQVQALGEVVPDPENVRATFLRSHCSGRVVRETSGSCYASRLGVSHQWLALRPASSCVPARRPCAPPTSGGATAQLGGWSVGLFVGVGETPVLLNLLKNLLKNCLEAEASSSEDSPCPSRPPEASSLAYLRSLSPFPSPVLSRAPKPPHPKGSGQDLVPQLLLPEGGRERGLKKFHWAALASS